MYEIHGVSNADGSCGILLQRISDKVVVSMNDKEKFVSLTMDVEEARYIAAWLNDFADKVEASGD